MNARDAILQRIRRHLPPPLPQPDRPVVREFTIPPDQQLAYFEAMLDKAQATHERCTSLDAARTALQTLCRERNVTSIAVSDSTLALDLTRDLDATCHTEADREVLLHADAGLCTVQLGICETGTLVLDHDVERHREVSLLPTLNIAVLRTTDLVDSLGAALSQLGRAGPSRAVTFVTGPSRTADIELTLIIGVHGPKALHVLLLENSP